MRRWPRRIVVRREDVSKLKTKKRKNAIRAIKAMTNMKQHISKKVTIQSFLLTWFFMSRHQGYMICFHQSINQSIKSINQSINS